MLKKDWVLKYFNAFARVKKWGKFLKAERSS